MDRWLMGIIAGFGLMIAVNGLFLYLAIENPAEVEASYAAETR